MSLHAELEKKHPGSVKVIDGASGQLDVTVDGKQIFSIQAPGAKFDLAALVKSIS